MRTSHKSYFVVAALIAAFGTTSVAQAGSASQVLINTVQVLGSSTAPFAAIGINGISGSPACALFPAIVMYVDLSTNKGRAILSTATAAMLAGKKVTIQGSNTCSTPSGSFTAENISILMAFQ